MSVSGLAEAKLYSLCRKGGKPAEEHHDIHLRFSIDKPPDVSVIFLLIRSELQHVSQDSNAPALYLDGIQHSEACLNRLGSCIVGVVYYFYSPAVKYLSPSVKASEAVQSISSRLWSFCHLAMGNSQNTHLPSIKSYGTIFNSTTGGCFKADRKA